MVLKTPDYWDQTSHLKMIDEIFQESMKDKLDDLVLLRIFDEETNSHRNDTILIEEGLTGVSFIPENSEYPDANPWDSSTFTMTKYKYGAKVLITEEMKKYNEIWSMKERIRSIVDEGMEMIEQSLADILLYGFSTSPYTDVFGKTTWAVGQKGYALFNSNDNNIIKIGATTNPELSVQALDAAYVMGATRTNALGQHKSIKYDTLLVSPALRGKAEQLVNSDKLPWSSDNAVNFNKGRFKIVESPRLATRSDGTDTSAYWFVFDSRKVKNQLKVKWAKKPELKAVGEVIFDANEVHRFSFWYSRGFLNFNYIAWSQGTASVAKQGIAVEVVNTDSNPVITQDAATPTETETETA